ncbi:MAG: 39S ribosomal protein L45 [Burkholderiales bacterium]|nr:39S ribosomal protein L45 [Burkholderiales bacterium]
MKLLMSVLMCSLVLASQPALASKRLGGGGSVGKQSGNVSQSNAAPTQSAAVSQPAPPVQSAATPVGAASSAKTPATAAPAVPAAKKPWGAMLGGLAAGLGLAWLASSLGLGEAFGNILLFGLLAVAVMAVVGMVMRSRQGRGSVPTHDLAYQGGAAGGQAAGHLAKDYSPQNVGNDASARPWERSSMAFETSRYPEATAQGGSLIGSGLPGTPSWGIPADFDVEGFLQASKTNFVNLQAAWDRADMGQLRSMMTDEMLVQIQVQLADRERQAPGAVNVTEVVMLEARLLGIEEAEHGYMASVEFSGMVREDLSAGPNPFREVWNITRPKVGTEGWLVAGVQALQ